MENEILTTNEELNETEVTNDYDESEVSGGGLGKLAVGLGVVAAAGVAAFVYKNKSKLEERKIEKLRKKGYVIYKADECEVREIEEDESVVEASEEN